MSVGLSHRPPSSVRTVPWPASAISRIALLPVSATTRPRPPGMRAIPIGLLNRELGSAPSRCAGFRQPEFRLPTQICAFASDALEAPVPSCAAASASKPLRGVVQNETSAARACIIHTPPSPFFLTFSGLMVTPGACAVQ